MKNLNTNAIATKQVEDFCEYKHAKNSHSKNIIKYQKFKIKENMSKINKRWKTLKDFMPKEDAVPSEVIYKGKTFTSAKTINQKYTKV